VASSVSLAALQHDISQSKPFPAPSVHKVSKNLVLTALSSTTLCGFSFSSSDKLDVN